MLCLGYTGYSKIIIWVGDYLREFVLAISLISLGSNQTFFLPHRSTEAASLFWSFRELQNGKKETHEIRIKQRAICLYVCVCVRACVLLCVYLRPTFRLFHKYFVPNELHPFCAAYSVLCRCLWILFTHFSTTITHKTRKIDILYDTSCCRPLLVVAGKERKFWQTEMTAIFEIVRWQKAHCYEKWDRSCARLQCNTALSCPCITTSQWIRQICIVSSPGRTADIQRKISNQNKRSYFINWF